MASRTAIISLYSFSREKSYKEKGEKKKKENIAISAQTENIWKIASWQHNSNCLAQQKEPWTASRILIKSFGESYSIDECRKT